VNRRYFIDENSMKDHFKTKLHKKRYIDFLSHNNHHQLVDKVMVCPPHLSLFITSG
jgi:hypothetical protein